MLHICMDASINHIMHNHITLITLLGVHMHTMSHVSAYVHAELAALFSGLPCFHFWNNENTLEVACMQISFTDLFHLQVVKPTLPPSTTNFCCKKNFHSQTIPSSSNQASSTDTCTNNAKFMIVVP